MSGWAWLLAISIPSAVAQGHDRVLGKEIQAVAHQAASQALFGKAAPLSYRRPELRRPAAVFVTITKEGRTRGCWGNVRPQAPTLADEITLNTRKALLEDYRFAPVNPAEYGKLRFYISLVSPLEPLASLGQLRPLQEGLLVTNGQRGGVLLPGEAKTTAWALGECCRKAGIKPQGALMYRFRTTVFAPEEDR